MLLLLLSQTYDLPVDANGTSVIYKTMKRETDTATMDEGIILLGCDLSVQVKHAVPCKCHDNAVCLSTNQPTNQPTNNSANEHSLGATNPCDKAE